MLKKTFLTIPLIFLFFIFLLPVFPLVLLPDISFLLNNQNSAQLKVTNFSGNPLSGESSFIFNKSPPIKIKWFFQFSKINELDLNLLFSSKDSGTPLALKTKISLTHNHLNIFIHKAQWSSAEPITQFLHSITPFPLALDTSLAMDNVEFSYSIFDNKIIKKNDFKIIALINNVQSNPQTTQKNNSSITPTTSNQLGDFKIIFNVSATQSLQLVNQPNSNSTIDIGCALNNNKCSWSGQWNLNDNWQTILAPLNIPLNTEHSTGWLKFPNF